MMYLIPRQDIKMETGIQNKKSEGRSETKIRGKREGDIKNESLENEKKGKKLQKN